MLERRQPEIRRILMPGDVVLAVRRLQPRRGVKHQNVRPDHLLNQVEDPGMAHQLGGPREQKVGLDPVRGVAFQAVRVLVAELDRLGAGAEAVIAEALRLRGRQQPPARQIAVPPVEFDFFTRQHGFVPVDTTAARLNACPSGTGNIRTPESWPPTPAWLIDIGAVAASITRTR